ncbi:MAG: phosphate acyltransferase PlsX [Clostridiales bacterium]|jgi:glycerol-3-phosphate acyltransferase PlsX|nr:phosphate acyltransferase PlsX [Clostridiales bacterium]
MKVVVDIMGADRGPAEIIKGAVEALADSRAVMVLVGDEAFIKAELKGYQYDPARIEIVDAKEAITNDDSPTNAIREKKESSLVKALEKTKNDPEVAGMVSAGSTGAVLTGAILKLGRIKGVARPCLAPLVPTAGDTTFTVVDTGANMDCKPEYLVQFAVMGAHYMRAMCGVENPRVALVSVGVEDKKGNELSKEAFARLKSLPDGVVNFVGNMEARDAMTGDYEVLVCDGFVGNVLIKSVEGAAMTVMKLLKSEIAASFRAKLGALFMKKSLRGLKRKMDYSALGGAALLGVDKAVVKSHGSSKAKTIRASIGQIVKMGERDIVGKIKESIRSTLSAAAEADAPSHE